MIGSLLVSESPRWLFRREKRDAAYAALLRSRTTEQADLELAEMQQTAAAEKTKTSTGSKVQGQVEESLLRRKYVIPFVLACVILACTQATGVNSIIGYNTNILLQAGLSDVQAHWGYVLFTTVNFLMTIGGVLLVDRKGRKFLLSVGTAGIIVSLLCTGALFRQTEKLRVDARTAVQAMVGESAGTDLRNNDQRNNDQRNNDQGATMIRITTSKSRCCTTRRPRIRSSRQPAKSATRSATVPRPWSSSIPMGISAPRPRWRVPMTSRPSRSKSRAKVVCPPTK